MSVNHKEIALEIAETILMTAEYCTVYEREEAEAGLWTEEDMQTIFELILHAVPTLLDGEAKG